MKRSKNILMVILLIALCLVLFYGLKTWNSEGKEKAASETIMPTPSAFQENTIPPSINITSNNIFDENIVTNTPVALAFKTSSLKDVYVNGESINDPQSSEKITETLISIPGIYEVIVEDTKENKAILKFSFDPTVEVTSETGKKASEIKSEVYTGTILVKPQGPTIRAQIPTNLTNGGSVSVEFVTLDYTSPNRIQSVTLDGERMEITGSVTTYVSGSHTVVVTDATDLSTTFTFTNNY